MAWLRKPESANLRYLGIAIAAACGALMVVLIENGNPPNMGVCGACFLRDTAGAFGLHGKGPQIVRPETIGVVFGALAWVLLGRRRFQARSGGHALTRLTFGIFMGMAAMVFLGCPFRMLQRLGGGDLTAWAALPAFIVGVGAGVLLEKRGYNPGKTQPAPAPVGLLGPAIAGGVLALFLIGGILNGPGPGDSGGPGHAFWALSLGIAAAVGVGLSATGFCAVSAARQVWTKGKLMLIGAGALIGGYAIASAVTGNFNVTYDGAPITQPDWLPNFLAMALLGLAGALAGGCPVRQLVMAGEGNADAFLAVLGIAVGGSIAHNLGVVSAGGKATEAGMIAMIAGLAIAAVYGLAMVAGKRGSSAPAG